MRKSLAILLIIALLSGYGIYWASTTLGDEIDNVQFAENVLYGDKSIVDGVTILRNTKYDDYMYWNTAYTIGEQSTIQTDFNFYELGKEDPWRRYYAGIKFEQYDSLLYSDVVYEENSENLTGLSKALYEVMQYAPAGTTTHKTVYLKDYQEYYTFDIQVNIPGFDDFYNNYYTEHNFLEEDIEKKKSMLEDFNAFFRIPILEEEVYVVGVNKNDEGDVIGYGYTSYSGGMGANDYEVDIVAPLGDSFYIETDSVYTEDTLYFTFSPLTFEGNIVDTSLIPGGYGIYSCKYDAEKNLIDTDSLQMVYSIEPAGYVSLELDTQGENLLVFTEDSQQFYLTVLDVNTLEEKQKIAYSAVDPGNLTRCYWVFEDYMIAQYDYYEAMVFSRNEDGTYTAEYTIPAEVPEVVEDVYFLYGTNSTFDWDGERLLISGDLMQEVPYYIESCGVYLAAFDETGLIYYAEYDSSLSTGSVEGEYWICEPVHDDATIINWN